MALGWYEAHTSVDNQLARLRMLLIMVHSVVEQAERVHIATCGSVAAPVALGSLARRAGRGRGAGVLRLFRSRQQHAVQKEATSRQ